MWRKTMSELAKLILAAYNSGLIVKFLYEKDFKQQATEAGVFKNIEQDIHTLRYLVEHHRKGSFDLDECYRQMGEAHESLLERILTDTFPNPEIPFTEAGPIYNLLNTMLKKLNALASREPKITASEE